MIYRILRVVFIVVAAALVLPLIIALAGFIHLTEKGVYEKLDNNQQ